MHNRKKPQAQTGILKHLATAISKESFHICRLHRLPYVIEASPMSNFYRLWYGTPVRSSLPNRVDVRSVEVSCTVPSPTPHYK